MSDHIVKAYDDDLEQIKTMLAQMGGLAEDQLAKAVDALAKRDIDLADQVIQNDEKIDAIEVALEEKVIKTIAKRQPMARDLRDIMVAIRIASDLERVGDLAKNLAKRAHAIPDTLPRRLSGGVIRMGGQPGVPRYSIVAPSCSSCSMIWITSPRLTIARTAHRDQSRRSDPLRASQSAVRPGPA